MIANLWNEISITCGCHGDETVPMMPHEGSAAFAQGGTEGSLFYSCPKYYPDQRKEGEQPCFNRITIKDYEEMVLKLSETLEQADEAGSKVNLTGLCWKNRRGTSFRVISHDGKGIKVEVKNKRAK